MMMPASAPALLAVCALLVWPSSATRTASARPAPFPPASLAWGVVLRHFFESDFGKTAPLPSELAALRSLDLVAPATLLEAGPLTQALLARKLSPGRFAGLSAERGLAELLAAEQDARDEARERAVQALAEGLADEDLDGAVPLLEQLAGPLRRYLSADGARQADQALPGLRRRLESRRSERLLSGAAATAAALDREPPPDDPHPHMKVRRASDGGEAARLAREFAAELRRAHEPERKRELVNGLWELAEIEPSRPAQRRAANALIGELRRRRRSSDAHRLLVLRAMRALADRTPYEEVERRLVGAALRQSEREGGAIARESEFMAESVASLSPFRSVRRLALKHQSELAGWTGDDARRKELERRIERLRTASGAWPLWKPPRPPTLWERFLRAFRAALERRSQ